MKNNTRERDRLIDLIRQSHCVEVWDYWNDDFKEPNPIETLADYLIKNGVVLPPCRVGETLYLIQIDYEGKYNMQKCLVDSKITMLSIMRAYEEKTVVYMSTDKSKAEQKLKEMIADSAK